MIWIGLTGGIASGKSTVTRLLREKSYPVLDADEVAREVVQFGTAGLKAVVQEFGPDLLQSDGSLNRALLAEKVFPFPEKRKKLESILHPLIREKVHQQRSDLEAAGTELALYDIPLLFETKSQAEFDKVIVVSTTAGQQRERMLRRNQWSEEEIAKRLAAQIPIEVKEAEADFVVRNDQGLDHLESEVERLVLWLRQLKES